MGSPMLEGADTARGLSAPHLGHLQVSAGLPVIFSKRSLQELH
jgi:hypothetical protein